MTDAEIEALLEPILKAAGSSVSHYSMYKPREEMRQAMRAAIAAAWEWRPIETAKPGEKYLVLEEDGEMNVASNIESKFCASWWKTNCNCGGDGDSTIYPVLCAKLPAAPEVKP